MKDVLHYSAFARKGDITSPLVIYQRVYPERLLKVTQGIQRGFLNFGFPILD